MDRKNGLIGRKRNWWSKLVNRIANKCYDIRFIVFDSKEFGWEARYSS